MMSLLMIFFETFIQEIIIYYYILRRNLWKNRRLSVFHILPSIYLNIVYLRLIALKTDAPEMTTTLWRDKAILKTKHNIHDTIIVTMRLILSKLRYMMRETHIVLATTRTSCKRFESLYVLIIIYSHRIDQFRLRKFWFWYGVLAK